MEINSQSHKSMLQNQAAAWFWPRSPMVRGGNALALTCQDELLLAPTPLNPSSPSGCRTALPVLPMHWGRGEVDFLWGTPPLPPPGLH